MPRVEVGAILDISSYMVHFVSIYEYGIGLRHRAVVLAEKGIRLWGPGRDVCVAKNLTNEWAKVHLKPLDFHSFSFPDAAQLVT